MVQDPSYDISSRAAPSLWSRILHERGELADATGLNIVRKTGGQPHIAPAATPGDRVLLPSCPPSSPAISLPPLWLLTNICRVPPQRVVLRLPIGLRSRLLPLPRGAVTQILLTAPPMRARPSLAAQPDAKAPPPTRMSIVLSSAKHTGRQLARKRIRSRSRWVPRTATIHRHGHGPTVGTSQCWRPSSC